MPPTVDVAWDDLFAFAEDWRTQFAQLQCTVRVDGGAKVGDWIHLLLAIPVLDETIKVVGRVMAPLPDGVFGLQIDPAQGDYERAQAFYGFVGRLVNAMLTSGRFQVTGQWAPGMEPEEQEVGIAGEAPTRAAPATPARAAAPGVAESSGLTTPEQLTALFMRLYESRATGILQVRSRRGLRQAFWKNGGILAWEADPLIEEECLGVLLARAGRIDDAQLRESLRQMNETGGKQGEALIEMGVLTFPQVVMALLTQVEIKTRNVFAEPDAEWSWFPMAELGRDFVAPPMKVSGFLFSWHRKRVASERMLDLEAQQQPWMNLYTRLAAAHWDDMRLKKEERALVEILTRKSYRYREIYGVSNVGRSVTLGIVLSLQRMGLLTFEEDEDVAQIHARWRQELKRKATMQVDQNPFEMLEVHWTSRTVQVEAAYKRLRLEYDGFGQGRELPPDVDALRQEILARFEAAYRSLKDTASRQAVRKQHYEAQQLDFAADLLFKQGEMLMVREQWDQVVDNFERAVELMPGVAQYKQFLEQARQRRKGSE